MIDETPSPSRRTVLRGATGLGALTLATAGAAGGMVAVLHHTRGAQPSVPDGEPVDPVPPAGARGVGRTCVAASTLTEQARVGSAQLRYAVDQQPSPFRFDATFHAQLDDWLRDWAAASGAMPTAIETYGAFVDHGDTCHSWHAAGRAFDLARLLVGGTVQASCRTDLWGGLSSAQRTQVETTYWRLAASRHTHFAYVLTHYFDPAHANHIHVDNSVSGGTTTFDTSSRVQNQAVQAICTHVWGVPTQVTGQWDAATRSSSAAVLRRLGRHGALTSGTNWRAFMDASMRHRPT